MSCCWSNTIRPKLSNKQRKLTLNYILFTLRKDVSDKQRDTVIIMKMRSIIPMRIAKIGYILISAAFCLVGIIMMIHPDLSLNIIGIFCGIAMITFGIVKLIGYFSKDLFRLAFQYDLQFGILMLVIGLIILLKPINTINFSSRFKRAMWTGGANLRRTCSPACLHCDACTPWRLACSICVSCIYRFNDSFKSRD